MTLIEALESAEQAEAAMRAICDTPTNLDLISEDEFGRIEGEANATRMALRAMLDWVTDGNTDRIVKVLGS